MDFNTPKYLVMSSPLHGSWVFPFLPQFCKWHGFQFLWCHLSPARSTPTTMLTKASTPNTVPCSQHALKTCGTGLNRNKMRSTRCSYFCLGAILWLRKLVEFFNRFAMPSNFSYLKQWEIGSHSSFSEKVWHFRHRLLTIINGIWLSHLILVLSF